MSSQDVEIVRRLYRAYERGDIDSMLQELHPDFEFDASDRLPDEGVVRGREAYGDFIRRNFEVWGDFRITVDRLVDADEAVVAILHIIGTGKGSGATAEERTAHVIWLDDGVPHRLKVFVDPARALALVGADP